ncbi:MAG TPA: beta-galactosidase trimerization domain-containing protein [Armatimonadota bacterium]|nr:beta-galactosidase trimerization domain-containing protein [Armatimonadota bacterium]
MGERAASTAVGLAILIAGVGACPAGTQGAARKNVPGPRPTLPRVLRNPLHWQFGQLADVATMNAINANALHAWPCPPDMPYAPPEAIREHIQERLGHELDELHEAGIRVMACVPSTGFDPAVWADKGLDPEDYYARDEQGNRRMMLGGSFGEHVFTSCYNNPLWLGLHESLAMMLADEGFDGLWYDVGGYADPAVLYCQGEHCKTRWQAHLADTGRDAATPLPTEDMGGDMAESINREHLRWRWKCWVDNWAAVQEAVRAKYPDFVFSHNLGVGANTSSSISVYLHAHTDLYDYVHWEEFGHGCAPYSTVPSYLLGLAAGNGRPVVLVQNDAPRRNATQHRIALAEACASGGACQNWAFDQSITREYSDFVEKHEDYYADVRSGANVAVVYSWWSKAIYEGNRNPAYWMGQMLLDLHVPFDFIIAERDLRPEVLDEYDAVILPDVACLTDEQIGRIRAYLQGGGGVIATHNSGVYYDEFLRREPSGLEVITDGMLSIEEHQLANASFEEPVADGGPPPGWARVEAFVGRVENPRPTYGWSAPEGDHVWRSVGGPDGLKRTHIVQDTGLVIAADTSYGFAADVLLVSEGKGGHLSLQAWEEEGDRVVRAELARVDLDAAPVGSFCPVSVVYDSAGSEHLGGRISVGIDVGDGFVDNCRLVAVGGKAGPVRLEVGRGKLVYFPDCPEEHYWLVNPRDFAKGDTLSRPSPPPAEVTDGLRWVLPEPLPVEVDADPSTVVIPKKQPGRLLVHLVNYNVYPDGEKVTPDRDIALDIAIPAGKIVKRVLVVSPDAAGPRALTHWEVGEGRLRLTLDRLEIYAVVVVELGA